MGNVELFELCETTPKAQRSQRLLCWNQGAIYCTCGHLLVESESSQTFNKLRLDALSLPHYVIKKVRPMVLGTVKLKHRNSTISPSTRGRDVAKELTLKVNISHVFTIAFSETKSIVDHNSQLAGQNKSAKSGMNWQNKITRTISLQRNSKDTKDNGISP